MLLPTLPCRCSEGDQRIELRFGWKDFERFLAARGESSGIRVSYLDGAMEIMSPSSSHELIKKRIARLLEAWSEE
ncbi:MAG: Uma2 family endonuclease, partial [Deltaproteobacteria bacterium]|nr:Uma2 family endonuclease [Deltaproteobacteria bacterium]